jgi:CheY-like chemotaxis protein
VARSPLPQKESTMGRSHLPLITLTAHAMSGDQGRCLAAGMDGHVPKPVNSRQLFAVIKEVKAPLHARLNAADAYTQTAHRANTPPVGCTPLDPPDWQQRNRSLTVSQHYRVGGTGLPNPTSGALAAIVRSVSPVDGRGLLPQRSPDGEVEKLRIARWKVAGERRLKV